MKRIGILVVAYNASSTLAEVLDRIPDEFRPRVSAVLVSDDHSEDSTYLVGLGYREVARDLPLSVIRQERNLGYGGNQKAGYRWAIDQGLDIVVLLHGDGQYAPERLPDLVAPLERGECDAVLGSRMMDPGRARRGGMPLYKYVGNRILTRFQNTVVGTDLSEWHSGYRAYSVPALKEIPFEENSDGFDFDTEVLLQLHEAGKRIEEIPIPTYYGDEICYVNGLRYAWDVTKDVVRYRAHKAGVGTGETAFASAAYERKEGPETSHGRLVDWLSRRPPSRVLDLGCSDGALAAELQAQGHTVVGVDVETHPGVHERMQRFVEADLEHGIPAEVGDGFDVVLAADVLEHVRDPARILDDARDRLRAGGAVVACVPNFAHWYPRLRVALGLFDYDRRGILDRGHLRFFTRASFERLVDGAGFVVARREPLGTPFEVLTRGRRNASTVRFAGRWLTRLSRWLNRLRPTLFAYQFVYELRPADASVTTVATHP